MERFPEFGDFVEFLEQRSHALGMIAAETKAHRKSGNDSKSQPKLAKHFKRTFHSSTVSNARKTEVADRKCVLCSDKHYIGACPTFLSKSPFGRRDDVRRLRLCFNCLGPHKFQSVCLNVGVKSATTSNIRCYTPSHLGRQWQFRKLTKDLLTVLLLPRLC